MKSETLLGQLQTVKNNYALLQAGVMFLVQPDSQKKFDEYFSAISHHPEAKDFEYIRYVFKNDEILSLATNQLRKSVLRNCIKEMFEIVKFYGESTGQVPILKAAPWYQFLRMTRNSLSHDFFVHFNQYDAALLPVSWSGLTYSALMHDVELPMAGFLTRTKVLELMDEVHAYVAANLV